MRQRDRDREEEEGRLFERHGEKTVRETGSETESE